MSAPVTFQSLCRNREIGANCYHLAFGDHHMVLDSGMHPEHQGRQAIPRHELLPAGKVSSIFLSHAHLDHCGTIPLVQLANPDARVFMTPPTVDLAEAMLHNSTNVMTSQRAELGIDEYPLFTHKQINDVTTRWEARDYRRPFHPDFEETITASFHDAGHVLGSAGIYLEGEGRKIFYTGDIQFHDMTLIRGAQFEDLEQLDALIVETTHGQVSPPENYTRQEEERRLIDAIEEVLARKGAVLIPVFAMGKTQEILTILQNYKEQGILRDAPIRIGGLSTKMTTIYDRYANSSRRSRPGFRILRDMELQAGTKGRKNRAARIIPDPGSIFALSSGMMSEKTLSNQFARQLMENARNAIFFVGYTHPSTPSYQVRNSKLGDLLTIDKNFRPVKRLCQVESFDFSGHAYRDQILKWISQSTAKKVILVHGDLDASKWFAEQLGKQPGREIIIPKPGEQYQI